MVLDKVRTRFWDVASCSYRQLLEQMESWRIGGDRHRYTCFCDAMGLAKGWRMGKLRRAYRHASTVFVVGAANKVLTKISGGKLPDRVIALYLFRLLWSTEPHQGGTMSVESIWRRWITSGRTSRSGTSDLVYIIGCRWLWRLLTGGKRTFKRIACCVPRSDRILISEF